MKKYIKSTSTLSEDSTVDLKNELRSAMDKVLSKYGLEDYYAQFNISENVRGSVVVSYEILCTPKGL